MLPLHIAGLVLDPLVLIGLLALFVREESNREAPRVLAIAWGTAVIGVCMASWSDSSDWDRANWLALGITAGALGALTHTISLAPLLSALVTTTLFIGYKAAFLYGGLAILYPEYDPMYYLPHPYLPLEDGAPVWLTPDFWFRS